MLIKITPQFEKQYKKLPQHLKEKAKEKEIIFRQDQFSAQLKTHKLHGKDKECWALWIPEFRFSLLLFFCLMTI